MAPDLGMAGLRAGGAAALAPEVAGPGPQAGMADAARGYRAAVVELMLSGQGLLPFSASKQELVAQAVTDASGALPHTLDISSIAVRLRFKV